MNVVERLYLKIITIDEDGGDGDLDPYEEGLAD